MIVMKLTFNNWANSFDLSFINHKFDDHKRYQDLIAKLLTSRSISELLLFSTSINYSNHENNHP